MNKIIICSIALFAIGTFYVQYADGNPTLGPDVESVLCRVTGIVDSLLGTVGKLLKSVDSLVNKLLDQVLGNLLGGLLDSVTKLLGNLLGGLLGGNNDDVQGGRGGRTGSTGGDGGLLGGLLDGVGDILDGLLKGLGPLLDQVLKLVGDLLKLVGRLLGRKGLLEEILGTTENLVNDTLCKMSDFTKGREHDPQVIAIVQSVTSELTFCTNSLLDSVTSEMGLIEGLLDAVIKLVNGLLNSLTKCLSGDLGGLSNCLEDLVGEVTKALDNIGKALSLDDAKPISGLLTEVNICINNALFNLISGLGSLGFCNNDLPLLCYDSKKK